MRRPEFSAGDIDSVGEIRGGLPERSKKEQNIPGTQCHYRTLINHQPDQPLKRPLFHSSPKGPHEAFLEFEATWLFHTAAR
jgi:hypothetical protein